jgi:integrase
VLWPALLAGASVPGLMMEDLRDTFGSWLLTLGIPIQYVSRQLGHSFEVPADLLVRLRESPQSPHMGDPYALPESLKSSDLQ